MVVVVFSIKVGYYEKILCNSERFCESCLEIIASISDVVSIGWRSMLHEVNNCFSEVLNEKKKLPGAVKFSFGKSQDEQFV